LALHVLRDGFDIKNPERFMMPAPPAVPAGPDGAPPVGPPANGSMMPPLPDQGGAFAPTGGVPPELLSQLQNQMGIELPNLV